MAQPVMPTRVLLVGGGGREHALAWRLVNDPGVLRVVVAPGSDGIAELPLVSCSREIDPLDPRTVVALARREAVDLVVVGPEAPLAAGVADAMIAAGIPVFGPTAAAAAIETSKAFCREVAEAAGVRMARGRAFSALAPAVAFAAELAGAPGSIGVVVKADGLAAGKGVTVCDDLPAATAALEAIFAAPAGAAAPSGPDGPEGSGGRDAGDGPSARDADPRVVVEERLVGREASLIALCDGSEAIALPPARDHKRIGDDDSGPNTGGMGAVSPLPDLDDALAVELVERVHRPVLAELARRGTPFRGALYAGLILTADGPVLLEFNARFGDPEAQALLPRLAGPFGSLLLAAALGELSEAARSLGLASPLLPATDEAAVAVVLAAPGYPGVPVVGRLIEGIDEARDAGALVFHAGTRRDVDDRWRTAGGRVLSVVGRGRDLAEARDLAERAADLVAIEGVQRRHDIGRREALEASTAGGADR